VPGHRRVCVSIAHSGDLAVAIAHEKAVGIDVEIIEPRNPGLEMLALAASERALLDRVVSGMRGDPVRSRSDAFTRFWAAKEAVSKAEGTGLAGRPTAFVVNAIDGDRLHVVCKTEPTDKAREYMVETHVVSDPSGAEYIVAWTVGWTLAEPALRPSPLDLTMPSSIVLRSPVQPATIAEHGGN
jgi:phosphopantetheinyl transferase